MITDYLRDRRQCVRLGNVSSAFRTVNIGVPQGSILGPLLFLYYVNDLPNVSKLLSCVLFADDTTLYASGNHVPSLINMFNDELVCVSRWMKANVLSLNVGKTFAMMFSKRHNIDTVDCQLLLDGSVVQFECHGKFLGVIIDNKLNHKQHIHLICKKVSKSIGIFYRLRNIFPQCILINLYYALIYPYFLYCIVIWGGASASSLDPVKKLQKRLLD